MNFDPSKNQYTQWEVDRYLLCDPTFDRDAFEQRMLEDLQYAEQVAAAVAELQAISHAAKICNSDSTNNVSVAKPQPYNKRTLPNASRWAVLATVAATLMAVSVWQFRNIPNDEQLSQLADNWVAFEGLTTAESLEMIATDDQTTENSGEAGANEQTDWLVEAAREFYLAKNEGAPG